MLAPCLRLLLALSLVLVTLTSARADPDDGAEAAPPGSVPGAAPSLLRERLPEPRVRVSTDARLSTLLGSTRDLLPPVGWGFGLQLSAGLLRIRQARLGFLLDYQQDRFSGITAALPSNSQQLVHNTFALQALLDYPTRWLRPFLAGGVGASVAHYTNDTGLDNTALVPLFRFSAGLGVSPLRWLEIAVAADVSVTVSSARFSPASGMVGTATGSQLYGPGWVAGAIQAGYRFY